MHGLWPDLTLLCVGFCPQVLNGFQPVDAGKVTTLHCSAVGCVVVRCCWGFKCIAYL